MKKIVTIVVFCMATCILCAQNEVSLVVSGEGKDKEEATFKALRSAIEQAYGTFVSANTTVLNDQLVADEIVSLSSGNIQKYEYVSENKMPNGNTLVTLSATVSIDKLVSFAESKGMEAELKGGLFAMNIKKMEFDKQAEVKAVENLCKQLETMLPTLFDYEIKLDEPKKVHDTIYSIGFRILAVPNDNYGNYFEMLKKSLLSISLNKNEVDKYNSTNLEVVSCDMKLLQALARNYFEWFGKKKSVASIVFKSSFVLQCEYGNSNRLSVKNEIQELGYRIYIESGTVDLYKIEPYRLRSTKTKEILLNFLTQTINERNRIVIKDNLDSTILLPNNISNEQIHINNETYGHGYENVVYEGQLFYDIGKLSQISSISVEKPISME